MPKNCDRTDFYWSWRGDFIIGPDGDIFSTENEPLRSLVQEVRTRLQSELGDWALYPDLASNLSGLVGEANNKQTAEAGKARITSVLSKYGLVDTKDITVSYIPISVDAILYRIKIRVSPTQANGYMDAITINISYNYTDNNIHFL